MKRPTAPWFVLVAGINGAGKSTFSQDPATLRELMRLSSAESIEVINPDTVTRAVRKRDVGIDPTVANRMAAEQCESAASMRIPVSREKPPPCCHWPISAAASGVMSPRRANRCSTREEGSQFDPDFADFARYPDFARSQQVPARSKERQDSTMCSGIPAEWMRQRQGDGMSVDRVG